MKGDASQKASPINILVPFNCQADSLGAKTFTAGILYHQPLVAVICEKFANAQDDEQFHYKPFKVFWAPTDVDMPVWVYGELYSSPKFLDAHWQVQELPCEPDCKLPCVVVRLMFGSDATHLTSFGNAKLWPTYLYFGNESKYQQCKPTCNLCNDVAYLETVSIIFMLAIHPLNCLQKDPRCIQGFCNHALRMKPKIIFHEPLLLWDVSCPMVHYIWQQVH